MSLPRIRYLLRIGVAVGLLWGCRIDTPSIQAKPTASRHTLLEQLTDVDESVRFTALRKALNQVDTISSKDIEHVLGTLREKNVSTLIYLFIKSQDKKLYELNTTAKTAIENAQGSFPNIAHYYGSVNTPAGLKALYRLYRRYPGERMAICLSIGETQNEKAHEFLLTQAKLEKLSGNSILAQLCGLKHTCHRLPFDNISLFLNQSLDREELIALSKIKAEITHDHLKKLWKADGLKKNYAIQYTLGDPLKHFDTLRWIIDQYRQSGQKDAIRQLLLSDGVRQVTAPKFRQYRKKMLEPLTIPQN